VVTDGVTGYTGGGPEELAALVAPTLALDRRVVRATAEARFGFRTMVDSYLELYRSMQLR
jgi:hypothetical protein